MLASLLACTGVIRVLLAFEPDLVVFSHALLGAISLFGIVTWLNPESAAANRTDFLAPFGVLAFAIQAAKTLYFLISLEGLAAFFADEVIGGRGLFGVFLAASFGAKPLLSYTIRGKAHRLLAVATVHQFHCAPCPFP